MIDATVQIASPIASVRPIDKPTGREASPVTTGADEQARQARQAECNALAGAKQALLSAIKQTDGLRQSIVASAEQEIVQLAIDVARKVLMQEIQAQRYEIDPIVQAALGQVSSDRQEVIVHLNPDDLKRCTQAGQCENDDSGSPVSFVADPTVRPAECLLKTPHGIVKSVVDEHLDEIAAALQEPQ